MAVDIVGLLDALAVTLGAVLPAAIYNVAGGMAVKWITVFQCGLVTSLIVYWCIRTWGHYDTTKVHNLPISPGRLAVALAVGFFAVLGLGMPFKLGDAHAWVWYLAWFWMSYTLLLLNRTVAQIVLRNLTAAGRFDTRVAVFGGGVIAKRVHDHLAEPIHRIQFVGMFDDRPDDRINAEGLPIAGRLDDLIALGREGKVDRIIIALPQGAESRIAYISKKLEQLTASVHVVTHISSDLVDGRPSHTVSSLGPVGLLDVKPRPLADWSPMLKRIEDVVLGILLTIAALPIMALIAIAIRLESKGPVLFMQRRRGLNYRVVNVLKFRTMTVAEDGVDLQQATVADSRITGVGRVLRRFSLDELPQLFNVLKGEMSLVGPRPHALVHDQHWDETVERYANRHQVKPGITGLAQIAGWRGETSTEDKIKGRVEQDLAYIAKWSLGLDLRILARTVWAVLKGKNAF